MTHSGYASASRISDKNLGNNSSTPDAFFSTQLAQNPLDIFDIFGSIAGRKHQTARIMAPYYRQLFTANPMALIPLSVMTLKGSFQGHESENRA